MNKSVMLYHEYRKHFEMMQLEEIGELVMAMLEYSEHEIEPELNGMAKMAFSFIRSQIDRDNQKYNEKCSKNTENGKKGGRPNSIIENPTEPKITERLIKKPKKANEDKKKDKKKDKNEDKDKNENEKETTTIVVGAAAGIYDFYETNIGTIAKTVCDDIAFYLDKGVESALIITCLKTSVDNNIRNWSYTKGILRRLIDKGITTQKQYEQGDETNGFSVSSKASGRANKPARKLDGIDYL